MMFLQIIDEPDCVTVVVRFDDDDTATVGILSPNPSDHDETWTATSHNAAYRVMGRWAGTCAPDVQPEYFTYFTEDAPIT